jgi:ABC-2 type transport system permease protein
MSSDARLVDTAFTTYQGPRAGRLAAIWSLARWSALRALGARRGWKAKLIPISLTLLAFAPALVVLGLRAILGAGSVSRQVANAVPYSDYISTIAIVVLVFSVVITPELVCPDRRDRTLSLYFSTAIGRLDYVLGKVAAALMPLLLVTLAPVLLLYVGTVLFAVHPVGYLQAHWLDLPRIIASSLIVATFYGLVGLAISSLTSRRAFAVGGYLAFLAISTVMGGVLSHALNERYFRLLAVAAAPIRAGQGLFPKYSDPGNISPVVWGSTVVEVCVLAVIVLAVRYGRDEG